MAVVPLVGHEELRRRLAAAVIRGNLPASLLLQGPRGVGKQRLALWLGSLLVCERRAAEPCGACQGCHFSLELRHPDIHWFFPRPRLTGDPDLDDVRGDYAEAVAERAKDQGLYAAPSGSEGIYVATIRAIVQQAVLSPALGKRKVFIIGDAERMVPQEGKDEAANAFLKLLEEPPADTNIILTSSEPGALLPTIRSRVVSFRAGPVGETAMREFLSHDAVQKWLKGSKAIPAEASERLRLAGGSPGKLLSGESWDLACQTAARILDAATRGPLEAYQATWAQASNKARGSFADTLDALTEALAARTRDSVRHGQDREALAASRAVELVEEAKDRITTNVNPQLLTINLIRELQELLR